MLITNDAVFESCFVVGRFTLVTEILSKIWEADARMRNLLNHQCYQYPSLYRFGIRSSCILPTICGDVAKLRSFFVKRSKKWIASLVVRLAFKTFAVDRLRSLTY